MLVDLEPSFVDYHLMVVPAEEDQVLEVGPATLGPGDPVMGLEPVSGVAAVGGTDTPILVEEGSS
jgi:hypothetical protein